MHKRLRIVVGLILALILVACATPTKVVSIAVSDTEIAAEQPNMSVQKESAQEEAEIKISWKEMPDWDQARQPNGVINLTNPTTSATITMFLLPAFMIVSPEETIVLNYNTIKDNPDLELSEISYSNDRSVASFSYVRKPNAKGEEIKKGKLVVLLVPDMKEDVAAVCAGEWSESTADQMLKEFDEFWMSIYAEKIPFD